MPKGPQGQKRPADTVSAAVMAAKIATGEIEEKLKEPSGKSGLERPGPRRARRSSRRRNDRPSPRRRRLGVGDNHLIFAVGSG